MTTRIYRIIDANYNRAKEGTRVCEDIARFILSNEDLTASLKEIRHKITASVNKLDIDYDKLLDSRNSIDDAGKKSTFDEMDKKDIKSVFLANFQRLKESIRVLEETSKLINKEEAQEFKDMRYQIYELEKEISKEISSLSDK